MFELFADRRLLTVSAGYVELAHEALLREWPRLAGWIEEDRAGLRIRRSLSSAARGVGRVEGATKTRSTADAPNRGRRMAREPRARPNELERDFLDASDRHREGQQRARRKRLQMVIGALAAALAVITAVAIIAIYQGREADRQRDIAASRELAARATSVLDVDPALSLALALRALERTRDTTGRERAATGDARRACPVDLARARRPGECCGAEPRRTARCNGWTGRSRARLGPETRAGRGDDQGTPR